MAASAETMMGGLTHSISMSEQDDVGGEGGGSSSNVAHKRMKVSAPRGREKRMSSEAMAKEEGRC